MKTNLFPQDPAVPIQNPPGPSPEAEEHAETTACPNPCWPKAFARPTPKVKAVQPGEEIPDPWSLLPEQAFVTSTAQSSQDGERSGGLPSEASSFCVVAEATCPVPIEGEFQDMEEAEADWYERMREDENFQAESQMSESEVQEELDQFFAQYCPGPSSLSTQQVSLQEPEPEKVNLHPLSADRAFLDLQRVAVESSIDHVRRNKPLFCWEKPARLQFTWEARGSRPPV